MKISRLILGRSAFWLSSIGAVAAASFQLAGCGQRGPLFLAPQSVPFTLSSPASSGSAAGAASAPASAASAPGTSASAAR